MAAMYPRPASRALLQLQQTPQGVRAGVGCYKNIDRWCRRSRASGMAFQAALEEALTKYRGTHNVDLQNPRPCRAGVRAVFSGKQTRAACRSSFIRVGPGDDRIGKASYGRAEAPLFLKTTSWLPARGHSHSDPRISQRAGPGPRQGLVGGPSLFLCGGQLRRRSAYPKCLLCTWANNGGTSADVALRTPY
jgi:hypothetical protein